MFSNFSKTLAISALIAAWPTTSGVAFAQSSRSVDTVIEAPVNNSAAPARTNSDILRATPRKNPLPRPSRSQIRDIFGPVTGSPGATTSQSQRGAAIQSRSSTAARANGSFLIPFTGGRVEAGFSSQASSVGQQYLSSTYPYRAIGRLTFFDGTQRTYCTATVIRRGIIVTAAHCIQDFASRNNMFADFQFTPAFWSNGTIISAPYGVWNWASLARPSSWADGSDTGSGSARNNDLAVIALAPQNGVFVGDRTGWLAYGWNNYSFITSGRTGNRITASINTLGYPSLMDLGRVMQMTSGPSYLVLVGGALNIEQGSYFTQGASGGPWIANFNVNYPEFLGGASAGLNANRLVVVGVTSWGADDPNNPKDNFASQFNRNRQYPLQAYGTYGAGNIGSLLNTLCRSRPSGSAMTLEQLGYCQG